jgi:DNA primase
VIGYAPPGWTRLYDLLGGRFGDQALVDAGVARPCSRGTLIDTFRERVMFGIRDIDGTIAGFIGRDLSGHPNAPKYLNTHRHAAFDKSKLLFGLHEGLASSRTRQLVVVEGPLDVLAITARELSNGSTDLLPVAPSGTAFTADQAKRLAELQGDSRVVVAMDGDFAGREAALAAGEQLRHAGADVRVAVLPNGTDPADYLQRSDAGLEVFKSDHGLPLITLHVERSIAAQGDAMEWPEGRLRALRSVTSYLSSYAPEFAGRQIGWLAETLGLQASTVTCELTEAFALRGHQHGRRGSEINL